MLVIHCQMLIIHSVGPKPLPALEISNQLKSSANLVTMQIKTQHENSGHTESCPSFYILPLILDMVCCRLRGFAFLNEQAQWDSDESETLRDVGCGQDVCARVGRPRSETYASSVRQLTEC